MKNEIETQKHIQFCESLLGKKTFHICVIMTISTMGPEGANICLKIAQRKLQQ